MSKKLNRSQQRIDFLKIPFQLFLRSFEYLSWSDLLKLLTLHSFFRKIIQNQSVWQQVDRVQKVPFSVLLKKVKRVTQRRSKGFMYTAVSRLDNRKIFIRKIDFKEINAGIDDGFPPSFLRQITNIRRCQSQHILALKAYDINQVRVLSFYQHASNLQDYLQDKQLSLEDKIQLIRQLIKAVNHIHSKGILHRNIKPSNIFISEGKLKLGDLSFSRYMFDPSFQLTPQQPKDRDRSLREVMRLWMRPPQLLFRRQNYSKQVDIWSVGCLIFYILTEKYLFKSFTQVEHLFETYKIIGNDGNLPMKLPLYPKVEFKLIKELQIVCKRFPFVQRILDLTITHSHRRASADQLLKLMEVAVQSKPIRFINWNSLELDLPSRPIRQWLTQISINFGHSQQTKQLALALFYRVGNHERLRSTGIQSLISGCLMVADVANQRSHQYYIRQNSSAYSFITAFQAGNQQIVRISKEICGIQGLNLNFCTLSQFIRAFDVGNQSIQLAINYASILLIVNVIQSQKFMLEAQCIVLMALISQGHCPRKKLLKGHHLNKLLAPKKQKQFYQTYRMLRTSIIQGWKQQDVENLLSQKKKWRYVEPVQWDWDLYRIWQS